MSSQKVDIGGPVGGDGGDGVIVENIGGQGGGYTPKSGGGGGDNTHPPKFFKFLKNGFINTDLDKAI